MMSVANMAAAIGWPGTMFILLYVFVERHATDEQKHEIIDAIILGKNQTCTRSILIVAGLAGILLIAQHALWKRRIGVLEAENTRLGKWKSDHQQKNIGTGLHHSE
jgi:hypothetical protein